MKKMKLSHSTMNENELSREQLKSIFGGEGSFDGRSCNHQCSTDSECHGGCGHCTTIPNYVTMKVCVRA